jgi:aminopeptidase N
MANLTVEEARERATSVSVTRYDIELDLDRGDTHFMSTSRASFNSADGKATFVDLSPDELHSVELNGQLLDTSLLDNGRFPLDTTRGPNTLAVTSTMAYSHDGEGLHRAVDPEDDRHYVYAMTFLDAAPRVFACFDQPDLKAEVTLRVKVPEEWIVLGNTRARRRREGLGAGEGWWDLEPSKPLATYFVTLVAGPYHSITAEHDGILLGLHCRQSLAEHLDKDAGELFRTTGQCFDEFHRMFGIRYPFGDYHQVFIPQFNAGAMENPGCVTLRDELVFRAQATSTQRSDRANTVAHEMAHQWFGDLVTMRWWDDLWLNESFADYMGHRVCADATDFSDNWLLFALVNKSWGLDADQRSSTHPVAGNGAPDAHSALNNFDGISYAKGAVVLRQLNAYLGDEAFLAGIVDHLQSHAYGNAALADLVLAWERASGKALGEWTHAWLRTSGVDTLSVRQGSPTVIERENGSGDDVSRIHAIRVTAYDDNGGATTVPVLVAGPVTAVELDSSAGTALVLPDSNDDSWVKVRLDPEAMAGLPKLLPRIEDPTSRAAVWGAVRSALVDARLSPAQYLDIASAALPEERADLVLNKVLTDATWWSGMYIQPMEQRERLEALVADMLTACDPGSSRQLLVARQLLRVSTDFTLLWSWLDGHAPEGLLVDSDMRWRVLERLCVRGEAGRDEIAREQQADPSSQGALAALRCSAAIPTAAAKAATWETVTQDRDINNDDLYALCQSFWRASQRKLTRPYVRRYFTELPATAEFRSGWVVLSSCTHIFPRFSAREEIVELAEQTVADPDLDPFARRAISDGGDDLRRLLASQRAYAEE